ncbi:MAG TPA: acyl-CoA dehydrogenase family protein [Pseudonocardia sp.]|nr:acyl-CoA dehydrogenase family protein [Pseudonocardia sp.]
MDLTLTEDQELIRTTAADLLRSRAETAGVRAVRRAEGSAGATRSDAASGYSAQLWKELVELGWPGLAISEEHGGVGVGWLELCLVIEQLGAAQVPSPLLITSGCVAPVLDRFAGPANRARLSAIASGAPITYARAAPGGDWGAATSTVVAVPSADGFTLTGEAQFVPFAADADAVLVAAQADQGLTVFLVDINRMSGLTVSAMDVVGPDPLYRVRCSEVAVSGVDVIGELGGGAEVITALEAFGAAASCAEMIGGAQRVLDMTVEYSGQREQFGRAIGSFQAVQHHCADMAVDVLGARFIGYEAIWRLAEGVDSAEEIALTVAAAKAWVSEAYERVCARGQQVHGAIGYTAEHDIHLYTTHAMATALRFGDGEFHLDRVAEGIGLPGA